MTSKMPWEKCDPPLEMGIALGSLVKHLAPGGGGGVVCLDRVPGTRHSDSLLHDSRGGGGAPHLGLRPDCAHVLHTKA